MSKRKCGSALLPHLSAKADNREKRFIQVGNSLLLSKQFHALSTGSRFLYFCMAMECGKMDKFIFPQKAAKKYGIAPSSLRKHINELEAARFIRVYSGKPTREPNRYEFCQGWKLPPSPLCSHTPMANCSRWFNRFPVHFLFRPRQAAASDMVDTCFRVFPLRGFYGIIFVLRHISQRRSLPPRKHFEM